MIEIGIHQKLIILRHTSVGLYLGDQEEEEDVLLPNKYCPTDYEIDDEIEVFVYLDYAERKVATTLQPKILLYQFALLRVTTVSEVGAFMDWGLEKELLVPFKEQKKNLEENRWYIVYLDLDVKTDRLYASNRLERFLQNDNLTVAEGEEVDLIIMKKTDLGFTTIINNRHEGLLFESDVHQDLNIGDKVTGYIKTVREDNKIDLSLNPIGYTNFIDPAMDVVYQKLQANKGFLPFTDKSHPDDIKDKFNLSKKAFKKALGGLYKQRKIVMEDNGIRISND
ncbi:MAG: putative RNA-binding protein (virulence factor B family) [Sphingobacteriales bacterium]